MTKVSVVRLDGTPGDEFRLAAAESLAKLFEPHIVGLIINVLPQPLIVETMACVTKFAGCVRSLIGFYFSSRHGHPPRTPLRGLA